MAQFRARRVFSLLIGTIVDEFDTAVSICWPWLAVVLGVTVVLTILDPALAPFFTGSWTLHLESLASDSAVLFLSNAVWFIATCSMAVNWHRYVLRKDLPDGWEYLRLDGPVWLYAWNMLLIAIIACLIVFAGLVVILAASLGGGLMVRGLVGFPSEVTPGGAIAYAVIFLAVIFLGILAIVYLTRLSIKLPAIALGEEYSFGDALRDSKGNTIRLFGFILLLAIPTIFMWAAVSVMNFLLSIVGLSASLVGFAVSAIVWLFVSWGGIMITLTAYALLYAVFANGVEID